MKKLTIVGKIDSRALVYPLARALSLNGLTGIITDDGAYRRLYHGKENIGTVSGVDIAVVDHVDEKSIHKLDNSGTPYENIIVVSSDFIDPETTGLIICHGLDRSMIAVTKEEEDDDFILPIKKETVEVDESNDNKSKKFRSKGKLEDKENTDEDEISKIDNKEETPKIETPQQERERKQMENPDSIVIPDNIPYSEVQIAYVAAPKKSNIYGLTLKDGLVAYVYGCEEEKKLNILLDKNITGLIAKIASKPMDIAENELNILLAKEEGAANITKGKPKK